MVRLKGIFLLSFLEVGYKIKIEIVKIGTSLYYFVKNIRGNFYTKNINRSNKESFQNNFDKTDRLIKTDDFIFLQKICL